MSILVNNDDLRALSSKYGTPLYVYNEGIILDNIRKIKSAFKYGFTDIHFALMCNSNPYILQKLKKNGIKAFVCSPGELFVALKSGFSLQDIILSGTGFTDEELSSFTESRSHVIIDSLGLLKRFGKLNQGGCVGVRINFDFHNESFTNDVYWGTKNRMGIWERDIPKALNIAKEHNIKFVGIHQYSGTNILDSTLLLSIAKRLISLTKNFPDIEYVDIGGGFGVDYQNGEDFKWSKFGNEVVKLLKELSRKKNHDIRLKLEPGRSIIGTAGALVAEITDIKRVKNTTFVCTDTSLSNFIRPYLYKAYHKIRVIPQIESDSNNKIIKNCSICGNTVAINDFLGKGRSLHQMTIGDLILISDVGAYGYSMSSHFCGRTRPAEVMIEKGKDLIIREREEFESLLYGTGY